VLLFNAWFKPTSAVSQARIIHAQSDSVYCRIQGYDGFRFRGYNGAGNTTVNYVPGSLFSADTWYHILISFDLSDSGKRHVYLDDSDLSTTVTWSIYTDGNLGWGTYSSWDIGSRQDYTNYTFAGCLSEVYLTNEYLDLSVEANRRKFIDASGKPVNLGSDGSTPTGTQPLLYFNNPAATWNVNKGSGGAFSFHASADHDDCSDTPSS